MKRLKILAVVLSLVFLTSCSSLTGVGEAGEGSGEKTDTGVVVKNDESSSTPSGTVAGLYNATTGEMKYAWAELEARGFITIKDNFITDSVEYLRGDLYIPNSISGIGKSAFKSCTGLTNLYVGNGVTTIGDSAFASCTGLVTIDLGSSITNIGNKAFNYCTRLKEVIIPDSVTNIGSSAFQGCTGLLKAHVGDEVTNISKAAFSGCTGLKTVRLGKNLTYIGTSAFHNCSVLSTVNYNGRRSQWGSIFVDKKNDYLLSARVVTTDTPTDTDGESKPEVATVTVK